MTREYRDMSENLKIAVTGATGHLGRILVQDLVQKNYRPKCLYRKKVPHELKHHVEWMQGDLGSREQIRDFLKGMDVLIHCASVISVGESNKEEVFHVNVEAVETLVDICSTFGTKLIYISSSTATKDPEIGKTLKENSPYREDKEFYYAWTKARAELIIRTAWKEKDLKGCIIRPTALLGPPDYVLLASGKWFVTCTWAAYG